MAKHVTITALATLMLAASGISHAVAPTARQVMDLFDNVEDGDAARADLIMLLIDASGARKQRQFDWSRLDDGADSKSRILFSSPADLKGTGFVGWNWSGAKDDDTWFCLPALQRCKRIASESQSGSFAGTDFTFYDINGFNVEDWSYSFVAEEETLDGEAVWVVEAVPAPGAEAHVTRKTGYRKFHAWISKSSHLMVKAHYWETAPNREKHYFAKDIREVDGVWTIFQQQMLSMERGRQVHGTVIQLRDISYRVDVSDSEMTTAGLMLSW